MASLTALLGNISVEEFFGEYFEKKVLHINNRGKDFYKNVLTSEEIGNYLDRDDIFYPSVRVVKQGKELPLSSYSINDVSIGHQKKNGLIDTERMMAHFNNNATIVIQSGHRYFEGVAEVTKNLSEVFKSPVQANLYITPVKSVGFNPHWDTHDVFVLQIAGTKTWHLYDFEKYLPVKAQPFKGQKLKSQLSKTIQLQPGDLLYVPRGYVHDAVADDGMSAHITVGVLSYTWERFFRDAMGQLKNNESFRKSVPLYAADFDAQLSTKIEEFKSHVQRLDFSKVTDSLHKEHEQKQPQPFKNYFKSVTNLSGLTETTKLSVNKALFFRLMELGNEMVLSFKNKAIHFPLYVNKSLEYITAEKQFTIKDLPENLSGKGKMVLIKRLIKEGFLYIEE